MNGDPLPELRAALTGKIPRSLRSLGCSWLTFARRALWITGAGILILLGSVTVRSEIVRLPQLLNRQTR